MPTPVAPATAAARSNDAAAIPATRRDDESRAERKGEAESALNLPRLVALVPTSRTSRQSRLPVLVLAGWESPTPF